MTHPPGTDPAGRADPEGRAGPAAPRDSAELARVLGAIAAEMARAGGFRVSAVSLFRASDELEFVVVEGDPDAVAELTGDITPTPVAMAMLERAERWGPLRFLPHDEAVELLDHIWVGAAEGDGADTHPDAWQPCDLLMAPLTDADGALQGIVWVDLPLDGRRPGPDQRRRLGEHAQRANRTMVEALEQERLREQVRLADAARRVVRTATADLDLGRLVQTTIDSVCDGFAVDEVRVHLLAEEDVADLDEVSLQSRLLAERCWRDQQVAIVSHRRAAPALLSAEEHAVLLDGLHDQGDTSLLLTPLGAGPECVGRLLMFRHDRTDWSDEEASAALDIGHDLGRAVLNARSFEREQQAAAYRQQLIATMAHELKNPLAAVGGYLDMLEMFLAEEPGTSTQVQRSLRGIGRATRRLDDIVADLLTLARFDEVADPVPVEPHDLAAIVHDVVEGLVVQAEARGVRVRVHAPPGGARVSAEPADLERLVVNLVSNAVKYSHDGGEVDVHVEQAGDAGDSGDAASGVVLRVADHGIGVAPAEQRRLFDEFYRSADPAAASQPGTGLGLSIVQRIVGHLDGEVDLESVPGEGSVFTVTLPGSPG